MIYSEARPVLGGVAEVCLHCVVVGLLLLLAVAIKSLLLILRQVENVGGLPPGVRVDELVS